MVAFQISDIQVSEQRSAAMQRSNAWLHFRSRTSRCRGSRRTCDAVHCIAVTHGCISDLGHPGVRAALCGDAGHCSDAVMQGCISDLGHPAVRAALCGDAGHCIAVMQGCTSDLEQPAVRVALYDDAVRCSAVMHGCISDLRHPGVGAAQCGDAAQ